MLPNSSASRFTRVGTTDSTATPIAKIAVVTMPMAASACSPDDA
jgi:hypothetical protein